MAKGIWYCDVVGVGQRATGKFGVRLNAESPPMKLLKEYVSAKAHKEIWSFLSPNPQILSKFSQGAHATLVQGNALMR
eukprot:5624945-Amphidinium_carterae.1